jgi:hypothetical protein
MKKILTILGYSSLISVALLIVAYMFFAWVPAGEHQYPQPRLEIHEYAFDVVESGRPMAYQVNCRYIDIPDSLAESILLRDLDRDILRIVAAVDVKAYDDPVTRLSAIQDSIIGTTLQSGPILVELTISRAPFKPNPSL